ncbi:hypothetical protein [Parerythrobacter aestuarii]|uniref:hypothetical protein n=1 Tax=Parerythrobacter aestuarii TaxID=3020909 RepID=UPI0024DDFC05|nr:hypothetical protein [Parerythrobacter aestuarii]
MTGIEQCQWLEPGGLAAAQRIVEFLGNIGIPVRIEPVSDSVLPGMTVRRGTICLDPATALYPGDVLHEAGHIAAQDPSERAHCAEVSDDPGEEMAAIAWSAAAARASGVDLGVVFHDAGYKGEADALRVACEKASPPGVAMLAWWGMTAEPHRRDIDLTPYPAMAKWLRSENDARL